MPLQFKALVTFVEKIVVMIVDEVMVAMTITMTMMFLDTITILSRQLRAVTTK